MRKVRPKGQRHSLRDDRATQIQLAPGILPGADSPALERPFSVERIQAETVNHVAGAETCFVPCFHIGGTVGEKVRIAPQIGGIAGKVPRTGLLLFRNQYGGDDVPRSVKKPRRIRQPVLSGGNAPGHLLIREKNFSGRERLIHLYAEMSSTGNPDNISRLINTVHGKQGFRRML
jgi:hypothetical protein